jgi:hypothetical protein
MPSLSRSVLCLTLLAACLVAPDAAHAAPQAHDAGRVYAIVTFADGTGQMTTWDVAPGSTAARLHRALQAQGVAGLVDPAVAGSAELAAADCPIDGAYAWGRRCGVNQVRWASLYPTVHMMDHTGAGWPVTNVVVDWDRTWAVHPVYHWYTSYNCTTNCVHLHNYNYGDTEWIGRAILYFSGIIITSGMVQLNDYHADTSWERRVTACHEMGHTLGLDHNLFKTSCMYHQARSDVTRLPSSSDFRMLEYIYP